MAAIGLDRTNLLYNEWFLFMAATRNRKPDRGELGGTAGTSLGPYRNW